MDDKAAVAAFPKFLRDLFLKKKDEKEQINVISHKIDGASLYEDAKVLLYPVIVKMILIRKWTENDLGKRPAYINATTGLSPNAMVDLPDDDVTFMKQEHDKIPNASLVSMS